MFGVLDVRDRRVSMRHVSCETGEVWMPWMSHFTSGGFGISVSFWMHDARSKKKNARSFSPSFSGLAQPAGYDGSNLSPLAQAAVVDVSVDVHALAALLIGGHADRDVHREDARSRIGRARRRPLLALHRVERR